ncbi:ABC transporter ATP-binding protein [Roseospira marina]|uniref:ABC transporter ATP-binding protein n=1 Tax=Roseospira marina TaxID=140057 RepID=A0A5M6IGT6_9PROT|nr:ABC transporter ATP-binding protein [Roseospira marina]KAA5607516.1 ABC transporter ATP-binding protein [Roseospira marina]MBB4312300.1 branched-chain amino acid transport system ATP-binding protein [Roseospira marina]MBB5085684.1 branched-chain amino acid transport system ATP-binding protein [Roseospira marina]
MTLLSIEGLTGGYGGADILHGVDLRVEPGEIVVIIGPNGAGKSTLMKAAFGLVKIKEGAVLFEKRDITPLRPDQIVRQGISYVPQERNVFPSMSVEENLEMGAFIRTDDIRPQMERIYSFFPRLAERRTQIAGSMSGGERQMLAMGRALMLDPKLLLLDEPTAGLSPLFIDQTFERIQKINAAGIGILMVEQNAKQALAVCDRGYVLTMGRNRIDDTGANLLANKDVAEMFLGG